MPINFQKAIIYQIKSQNPNISNIYLGSTCKFNKRKFDHKRDCGDPNRRSYNLRVYEFIRKNGGMDKWDIVEIEKYPCKTKKDLCLRERYYYEKFKTHATLNTNYPARTYKEYYDDNRVELLKKYKKRRRINKLKMLFSTEYITKLIDKKFM
jgi:hypothetical protein